MDKVKKKPDIAPSDLVSISFDKQIHVILNSRFSYTHLLH